ncbi:MAG: methyltransferase domain-containing protein [Pseudonocardiaceae bacterium]
MSRYPTDLTPVEEQRARDRLAALAGRFTAEGDLRSAEWREAFLATWRHPYVPAYYPSLSEPHVLCIDPRQRATWLDAVYSNETLVTKVAPIPLSRAFRPATGWMYTSSSTLPSLVLRMLEALDVRDGHRVLEIGTGSGYTCALLCQRLGNAQVTSVDIDPELIDLAGERLAANGYTPTLAAVDGADGHPAGAPYDRIIATCAVRAIPAAWLTQTMPGTVLLADVHGQLGGTLVRLTVDTEGTAAGRFLPRWAGFMGMRHSIEPNTPPVHVWVEDESRRSATDVNPSPLLRDGELLGFLAQWQLPGVHRGLGTSENGQPALCLWAEDGSQAIIETATTNGRHRVAESGPQRLWHAVEQIHEFWHNTGQPSYERFGLTATQTEQYVWLDDPDSPHRWPLSS